MAKHTTLAAAILFMVGALSSGCSAATHRATTVPLLTAAGIPLTATPTGAVPLEVITRSTAIADPLPVEGSDIYYADIEAALGHAVSSATVPWAEVHREEQHGGWALLVEITQAHVAYVDGRMMVSFNVRATLKTRVGNIYIAQTHANCRQAGLIPDANGGGPIVYTCMTRIGRDINGWLGGLDV